MNMTGHEKSKTHLLKWFMYYLNSCYNTIGLVWDADKKYFNKNFAIFQVPNKFDE